MDLEFVPYVGALPLRFGMARAEVREIMCADGRPFHSTSARDGFEALGVNYDAQGLAAEFCLFPRRVLLTFDGVVLLGPGAAPNPVPFLLRYDPNPIEKLGFLVFLESGVNLAGFHDDDPSQSAFNVFRRGYWNELLGIATAASEIRLPE